MTYGGEFRDEDSSGRAAPGASYLLLGLIDTTDKTFSSRMLISKMETCLVFAMVRYWPNVSMRLPGVTG